MQHLSLAALSLTLLLSSGITAPEAEWVELFDGQTLEGWTTKGGRYDGALTLSDD